MNFKEFEFESIKQIEVSVLSDKFIHFTTNEVAQVIKQENKFSTQRVYAISTTFGCWSPKTQFNHVIHKSDSKLHSDEVLSAVVFKASKMPFRAACEEIVWIGPLLVQVLDVIKPRRAIEIIKNTPYGEAVRSKNLRIRVVE